MPQISASNQCIALGCPTPSKEGQARKVPGGCVHYKANNYFCSVWAGFPKPKKCGKETPSEPAEEQPPAAASLGRLKRPLPPILSEVREIKGMR